MLNWIFLVLIGAAVLVAAFTGRMPEVTSASLSSAKTAVELAIGLVGQMALWLGFMAILREAGLMRSLARGMQPLMTRLFPEVPKDHPAMGAMIMNLSANVLGLANAATPFGLKAMAELNKLNRHPGVATNSMALFLAINTSGVAVLPLGVVAVRATLGSKDPAGIIIPTLIATAVSTTIAVLSTRLLQGRKGYSVERALEAAGESAATAEVKAVTSPTEAQQTAMQEAEQAAREVAPASGWRRLVTWAVLLAVLGALVLHFLRQPAGTDPLAVTRSVFSDWLLPILMLTIVVFGFGRRVKIYEVFVSAAKEGFQIAIVIIPFLVAILVAIGMFRASGAMEALVSVLSPVTELAGFPAEALPMALVRPLSGSGALAVMSEIMKVHGPDSFIGYLVSVLNGSTETTFYVLAVYYGSVQVRAVRHTVLGCLAADAAGIMAAAAICHVFFG